MSTALALVGLNGAVAAITAAGAVYFTRVRMPRPPVGRYELPDVAVMGVVVVAAPLVYLAAPRTAVAVVFGLVLCAALQFTLAPLIGGGGPGRPRGRWWPPPPGARSRTCQSP